MIEPISPIRPVAVPPWSGRYRLATSVIPRFWRHWLLDSGSLTLRLIALKPGCFNVRLLREHYENVRYPECLDLELTSGQSVWVREVALCIDDQPVVYGRTVIPLTTIVGKHRRLQHLGNRSLGSYLFRQPGIQRQSLIAARVHSEDMSVNWCRRSVFTLDGRPILVTESFADRLKDIVANRSIA